ncbi:MAG: DEAD/DEAH box helicase [Clostridiales bacterium]|nr:DEAD/DEAH box helicase [Clostridiales bacterium]
MEFKNLNISESILKAIDELGFKEATTVQSFSIPEIMAKKDLIVMAKTGSGKTGAFSLPIIEGIDHSLKSAQALIITPTRELAVQVNKDISSFIKYTPVKTTTVYGGHNMSVEEKHLKEGAQIVTGTPGRVIHHLKNRKLETKNIKYLVLDEADRMLDMGFIDQMYTIIKALPKDRVTLLFSATMPDEIQKICKSYMKEPVTIEIDSDTKTVDSIKQEYIRVERNEKRTQLSNIICSEQPNSCMIFCNTRVEVDKVENYLNRKGFVSEAIHGANTQSRRMRTIEEFKNGDIQILVATDVAARGIHIDDMSLVINYDVPVEKDSYIHRIGRTGRAGNGGKAITLVTSDDIYALYEIEEHAGAMIEEVDFPSDEDIEEGKIILNSIWAEKKAKRKPRVEQRPKSAHKPKGPHKSTSQHKPKGHSTRKPQGKSHGKPERREHPKMHKKPVQQQIEKAYVNKEVKKQNHPVQKKPIEPVKPIVKPVSNEVKAQPKKKKKFSLRNLFKKK